MMQFRLLLVLCITSFTSLAWSTALDEYVAAPDEHYRYELESMRVLGGATDRHSLYTIKMYSQQWRSADEVDKPVWEHWLTIAVPEVVRQKLGLLIVAGGGVGGKPPKMDKYTGLLIGATGAVVALLEQVPNQPLLFSERPLPRSEDEIIAYTYHKYMETGDDTWPALLPMTKSAVRAMDTVETILEDHDVKLDGFVVTGGSKRGWTTWLTGAADPRVKGIVPIVIDVLQMDVQMKHHHMAYGDYSQAVVEYVDENVFDRFLTPRGQELLKIVDPYEYLPRFTTMPKYLVNATGDEFFVLDSSRYYWDDVPGPKWLRYVPNSGHGIEANMETLLSAVQFFKTVAEGKRLPRYEWKFPGEGDIEVTTDTSESRAQLYQASNPVARDFRWYGGTGPRWRGTPLAPESPGRYRAHVDRPEKGWTAYFVELSYPDGLILSTEVRVTPDCLPYTDGDGDGIPNVDDPDDDNDGLPDGTDPNPCDADNDGLSDSYEEALGVNDEAAQLPPAPPPAQAGAVEAREGKVWVLVVIITGLLALAGGLLYVLGRRR